MVVHQDDYVELTLVNPHTNTLQHNIDFHAATGALGGGALTLVNPGETAVLRFKATRAGTWHSEPMPEETHATIYHPAALRAFRAVFRPQVKAGR